ncbi:MAG: M23 family metallopeptidase [Candidatus Eisenbacteria bacterium]
MNRSVLATAVAAALAFASLTVTNAAAFDAPSAAARGRALLAHAVAGEPGPLWDAFAPSMRTAMKDSVSFAATLARISASLGALDSLTGETSTETAPGAWTWVGHCRYKLAPVPIDMTFAFDADGRVIGMFARPAGGAKPTEYASPNLSYETKTVLRPPFEGEWFVGWGGRTLEQNRHASTRDQRFAMDLVMQKDGATHKGDGKALADYWCYGARALAPAAGTIVWASDSLPDNPIGSTDLSHPIGNGVVVDHGNGEFSLIAHLQPHSLKVKTGDRVKSGQWLGLVGNSGNTSQPHIHYHLQNGPKPFDAEGLPAPFTHIVVNGVATEKAEVVKGQLVAPGR